MNWRVEGIANLGFQNISAYPQFNDMRALMISPPDALLRQKNAAVILSRLPIRWNSEDVWLSSVRQAIDKIKYESYSLVTTIGSSGWEYITWYAGKIGVPTIVVIPPSAPDLVPAIAEQAVHDLDLSRECTTFIAPLIERKFSKEDKLHCRDYLIIELSERFFPVVIRSGGYWEDFLTKAKYVSEEYWVQYPRVMKSFEWNNQPCSNISLNFSWADHLIHLTRGMYGPWSGERKSDYFTALTQENAGNPRDELATLTYILSSGILRGSGSVIRGGVPVSSFSSLPPHELLKVKSVNARLHGAGHQPFGFALPRKILLQLGAKHVVYGTGSDFETLPAQEKPYYQARGGGRSRKNKTDWSKESEFRLVGDLDLASLKDELIALVPSMEMADRVREEIGCKAIPLFKLKLTDSY